MKIALVIDVQNDFVNKEVLGTNEAIIAARNVARHITQGAYDYFIITQDTHYNEDGYLKSPEGQNLPVLHCQYLTEGWKLTEDFSATMARLYISYGRISFIDKDSFFSMEVYNEIRKVVKTDMLTGGEEELELTIMGLCTDICVISHALALRSLLPHATIIVKESCCAGTSPQSHENALKIMALNAIKVIQ